VERLTAYAYDSESTRCHILKAVTEGPVLFCVKERRLVSANDPARAWIQVDQEPSVRDEIERVP
jgi:hypothetical protein